jgi:hypothetical protein
VTDHELLELALERSGLSARRFARELMLRDEKTLRAWRLGGRIPAVVKPRLKQLARRRRRPWATPRIHPAGASSLSRRAPDR